MKKEIMEHYLGKTDEKYELGGVVKNEWNNCSQLQRHYSRE